MGSKVRLTPEKTQKILAGIRAGAYPYIAAEANGVPKEVFDDWMSLGSRKNAWEPYRSFAEGVREAFAQARVRAETENLTKNPKLWLIHGPGRETEQYPGWSASVKAASPEVEAANPLCDPVLMNVLRAVLDALGPFPEARLRVAQVLASEGVIPGKEPKTTEERENPHDETILPPAA